MPKKKTLEQIKKETQAKIEEEKKNPPKRKRGRQRTVDPKTRPKSKSGKIYRPSIAKRIKKHGVGSGNGDNKPTRFGGERANPHIQEVRKSFLEEIGGGEEEYNTSLLKYKTSKERREVFKKLLEHLSKGKSVHSFKYLGKRTIKKYLRDFPNDFPRNDLLMSQRESLAWWEDILMGQATGMMKGSTKAATYFMGNNFGMKDRQDITSDDQAIKMPILVHELPIPDDDE